MKKLVLLSLILAVIGVAFAIVTSVDARPIPIPAASMESTQAFPLYDQIYRDGGRQTSHGKAKFVVFRYRQFHGDGTVVGVSRSVTNLNDLNDRFYKDLAKELALDGKGDLRQVGSYEAEGGKLTFTLGHYASHVPAGQAIDAPHEWYQGEINGNQIKVARARDGAPYRGLELFTPVGPEAHWDTLKNETD